MFKRDWTTYSNYVLNDHLMSTIIVTLITNKVFLEAPSIMKKAAIASMIWIDSIS